MNGNSTASNGELKPAAETVSAVQVVRSLVARRTELPAESIQEEAHLLRDLHLNSIVVGEIVAAAARQLGLTPPRQLLEFADATIGQAAKALERLRSSVNGGATDETSFAGIDDWQRPFFTVWRPAPLRKRAAASEAAGTWRCLAPYDPALVRAVAQAALPG